MTRKRDQSRPLELDPEQLMETMRRLSDPAELDRQLAQLAAVCPLCLAADRAGCGCPS